MALKKAKKALKQVALPLSKIPTPGRWMAGRQGAAEKIGLPPGKAVYVGPSREAAVTLSLIEYRADHLREETDATVEGCLNSLAADVISWINVSGVHDVGLVERIGERFGIHDLVMEDVVNTAQRPKFEEVGDQLFVVLKMMRIEEDVLLTEQVSLIVGNGFVISFQEEPGDVFEPLRRRIRDGRGRVRHAGADYLAYALIDSIIDHYFVVVERLGEHIEHLEAQVTDNSTAVEKVLPALSALKRDLIMLRRAIWPLREAVSAMLRSDSPLIVPKTAPFLRDAYDHAVQIADMIETFRDLASTIQDLSLSMLSHRMNEVMKVLTIVGSIFIPLTFIAGIYGMNFTWMPELGWKYGYPTAMAVMITLGVGLLLLFRRKHWL